MVTEYTFNFEFDGYVHQVMIEDFTTVSAHAADLSVHLFHIMFIEGPDAGFATAIVIRDDPMSFYHALRGTPVSTMTDGKDGDNVPNPMHLPKPGAQTRPIVEATVRADLKNDVKGIADFRSSMPSVCVCGSGIVSEFPMALSPVKPLQQTEEPVLMDFRFALMAHFCPPTGPGTGPPPPPPPGSMPTG